MSIGAANWINPTMPCSCVKPEKRSPSLASLLPLLIVCTLTLASGFQTAVAADVCPARRPPYDAKNLKQCVEACIACDSGTTVTCTTSCTLKGAK
jgi:hypothetical protein